MRSTGCACPNRPGPLWFGSASAGYLESTRGPSFAVRYVGQFGQTLLDHLNDGFSIEGFIEIFLGVDAVDAADFLELACETSVVGIASRGGF